METKYAGDELIETFILQVSVFVYTQDILRLYLISFESQIMEKPEEKGTKSPLSKKPKLCNENVEQRYANAVRATGPTQAPSRRALLASTSTSDQGETSTSTTTGTDTATPISTAPDAQPPLWFTNFEKRQRAYLQTLLDDKLGELINKITVHEEKINSIDFDVKGLQDSVHTLKKENELLTDKLDDLENRSRRCNLVIFGIGEPDGKEDCGKTVSDFLRFVGRDEDINNIERCHRTPTIPPAKLKNGHQRQLPRRIHVGFNSFVAKERVRKSAIDKLKSTKSLYGEQQNLKVFVAEDLSRRVIEKRKKKSSLFNRLKEEGKRPFFAFPDRLCFRDQDGKIIQA